MIQRVDVKFNMDQRFDAIMEVSIGWQSTDVDLFSTTFDFERFINWLKQIGLRLPVLPYLVDEVNGCKKIFVHDVAEPSTIGFGVADMDTAEISVFGHVDRRQFIHAFKTELKRFFTEDYDDAFDGEKCDPEALREALVEILGEEMYQERYGEVVFSGKDGCPEEPTLRQRILADPWLCE